MDVLKNSFYISYQPHKYYSLVATILPLQSLFLLTMDSDTMHTTDHTHKMEFCSKIYGLVLRIITTTVTKR